MLSVIHPGGNRDLSGYSSYATFINHQSILNHTYPTMAAVASPATSEAASEAALRKQDRRKLKKLRNRVFKVQNEGERSGLLKTQEWLEYLRLEPSNPSPIGPAISKRQRKEGIKAEGAQHRDLLAWLLKQVIFPAQNNESKKSKKRSRDEAKEDSIQTASIPSWASVHNPGILQTITVLEIHVPSDISSYMNTFDSFLQSSSKSHHAKVPTKWFQGPAPRSISEVLLYFAAKKSKKAKVESQPASREEVIGKLQDLVLQRDDWKREGYPIMTKKPENRLADTDDTAKLVQPSADLDPSAISLVDAKALVEKLGTRINNQNDEDDQPYIATISRHTMEEYLPRVFGLDCEMVRTSAGSELARITLVQFENFQEDTVTTTTVLDALVKPDKTIIDYLTRHSGITPTLLEPVSIRLPQVQVAILRYLRPNDILIGHSLENDLKAAHYIHPNCIDTALIFRPSHKRTKFSLRHLSAFLLQKKIQSGSHCSEEDATTALELAIRMAWFGDSFYDPSGDERRSLFEGLKDARIMCTGPATWLQAHITSHSNGIHALGYENINECKKAVLAWQKSPRKTHLIGSQLVIDKEGDGDGVTSLNDLLVRKSKTYSIIQRPPMASHNKCSLCFGAD
jgi:DNA polymerase III epsilon subunit-like protein